MAELQALMMAGPLGALGYWQKGEARNLFEPALHPKGVFTGRLAQERLLPAANGNHIPFGEFEKAVKRQNRKVIPLPRRST